MSIHQKIAVGYFVFLMAAASINYIPGLTDENGVAFNTFALDIFDDLLHVASALWALIAALKSARAARLFLILFGAIYLGDGLMGMAIGSGYLDLGFLRWGVQDQTLAFKLAANAPHLILGGFALFSGLALGRNK